MKIESKYSLEVVRQQNECTSMLPIQGPKYIILGLIWPSGYTILVYNIRVHEADVIVPLSSHSFTFILRNRKKRGYEKAHKYWSYNIAMRGNTYIRNTLMRDLSRVSWWYRNQRLTNLIHTSASPWCKLLSLTRAANITSPSAVALMYHSCSSRILIGSMFNNSGYIRDSCDTQVLGIVTHWILVWSCVQNVVKVCLKI
jgi:hypothetical protein